MINIIDANNLAGKLGLLREVAFDEKLIRLLSQYKKGKYILVFDGRDRMGDRYARENITVIYTPKDEFYKSADDKIIELAKKYLDIGEEVKIITDDLEIIGKVEKIAADSRSRSASARQGSGMLEKATDFAKKLNSYSENRREENKLADDETDEINSELFDLWNK